MVHVKMYFSEIGYLIFFYLKSPSLTLYIQKDLRDIKYCSLYFVIFLIKYMCVCIYIYDLTIC